MIPAPVPCYNNNNNRLKVLRLARSPLKLFSPLELLPLSSALRKSAKAQINKASRRTAVCRDLVSSGEPNALRVGRLCFLESARSAERLRWPQNFQEKKKIDV